jgi:hypothetical protein
MKVSERFESIDGAQIKNVGGHFDLWPEENVAASIESAACKRRKFL